MSATPKDPTEAVPPVAPDRPYVDGSAKSPDELRAEVRELADERRDSAEQLRVEELRAEVGATIGELAARFDVPARVRARKDRAVDEVRGRPGAVGGAAAAVVAFVALLVALRRRRRR
jgi:hypothetical protein